MLSGVRLSSFGRWDEPSCDGFDFTECEAGAGIEVGHGYFAVSCAEIGAEPVIRGMFPGRFLMGNF